MTEWDEVKRVMTWSRYRELHEHWRYEPPAESLLTYIASAHGYRPLQPPKRGEEAMRELKQMFPGGVIRGPNG